MRILHVPPEFDQGVATAIAILDRGRGDDQGPEQAERVDDDVSFTTDDFFSPRRSRAARLVRWS
jgi:hypothetical protein